MKGRRTRFYCPLVGVGTRVPLDKANTAVPDTCTQDRVSGCDSPGEDAEHGLQEFGEYN